MQFISNIIPVVERSRIPDTFARFAISLLVARTSRSLSAREKDGTNAFASAMSEMPIATNVAEANAQHYELPPTFFELISARAASIPAAITRVRPARSLMRRKPRSRRRSEMRTSPMAKPFLNSAAGGDPSLCLLHSGSQKQRLSPSPIPVRKGISSKSRLSLWGSIIFWWSQRI